MIDAVVCDGWQETFLDIFVVTKAVVLTFFSVRGILWFRQKKFNSLPVIITLIISIAIVSRICNFSVLNHYFVQVISECVFRFTNRHLRYRFF